VHLLGRDAMTVATWYAAHTESIRVGTGVVPIYTRTPAAMAQEARTIDDLSGGRFTLGLGVSHRPVVEGFHGQTIDKPASEMREYAGIVRAIFRGEPPPAGEKWTTYFQLSGLDPSPAQPIYVAALSPRMLRLAGEIADGVILWLCTSTYVRDVVVPEVTRGREKAGRTLDGFDIVAAVPSAVTDDPEAVRDRLRASVATPYFSLPFYRAAIERSGFADDVARYDSSGGDPSSVSDAFLEVLSAIGSAEDVVAGLRRYRDAGATSPCVSPIPGTDIDATLRAAAGALD
jgi:F420-dependent oxidoreductase-like protein